MQEVIKHRCRLFFIAQSDILDWIRIIFTEQPSVFLSSITKTTISMPKDVSVKSINFNYTKCSWSIVLESQEWPEIPEGEEIPVFDHIFAEKVRSIVIPISTIKGVPKTCTVDCADGTSFGVNISDIFNRESS